MSTNTPNALSHVNADGSAHMVDVSAKTPTARTAIARGELLMRPETARALRDNALKKGDALAVARVAGILAAKNTPQAIPLCHPISLTHVAVDIDVDVEAGKTHIQATVRTQAPTGVEMEALHAVSTAALSLYDMAKAVDKQMVIGAIRVTSKSGGRSGERYDDPLHPPTQP